MSEAVRADLMMGFRDEAGGIVWAESTLDVDKGDSFLSDYKTAPDADYYSSFFEVKSFNFAMTVDGSDKESNDKFGAGSQKALQTTKPAGGTEEFGRWRSAEGDDYKTIHFPVQFNNFNFTRLLDAASTTFFQACCNSTRFYSAALVKRVSVGSNKKPRGYLRFDFRDVMLTSVNWEDGELVTESCEFICRAMRLRYKQQNADGSLASQVSTAVWPRPDTPTSIINDPKLRDIISELLSNG